MKQFIKLAILGTDGTVSSRRLITFISVVVGIAVDVAIIVLAFRIALTDKSSPNAIQAMDRLIHLAVIIKLEVFLLAGIITWQNINETARIVKGIPGMVTETQAVIKQTVQEPTLTTAAE
jgi:uncharacterized protein (DUF486 family)